MNEFELIEKLKKKIPKAKSTALGIGDDAAVLKKLSSGNFVVSTDMLVEDVDFVLGKFQKPRCHPRPGSVIPAKAGIQTGVNSSGDPKNGFPINAFGNDMLKPLAPEKIGRKALAVNLSDLAAMGAEPLAFVLAIGKPKHVSTRWLGLFYDGLLKLAKQYKVDCIGGDFSGAKEFSVSVTILGKATRVVPRSGAKAGDWIGVTGNLGGSILKHHYDFMPRIREGIFLSKNRLAHAMIDISDGLHQDLQHILNASRVGAEVRLERIPVSKDALKMSRGDRARGIERALTEGEDFELLFTASPESKTRLEKIWKRKFPKVPLSWIGRIVKGRSEVKWFLGRERVWFPDLEKKGFKHF